MADRARGRAGRGVRRHGGAARAAAFGRRDRRAAVELLRDRPRRDLLRNEPLIALYVAVIQSARLDAVNRHLIDAKRQLAATGQQDSMFNAVLDRIGSALHARA